MTSHLGSGSIVVVREGEENLAVYKIFKVQQFQF